MKKIPFILLSAFMVCQACSKESTLDLSEDHLITIKASIQKPQDDGSKSSAMASYEDNEGIKVEWEADDVLLVFDESGNISEFTVASVDGNGIATFSGTASIDVGSTVTAFLKNSSVARNNYDSSTGMMTVDLSGQKGDRKSVV